MKTTELQSPKYKVGQKVCATWAGGAETVHTITKVEKEVHGFWYSWIEDNGVGFGTYEKFLTPKNN